MYHRTEWFEVTCRIIRRHSFETHSPALISSLDMCLKIMLGTLGYRSWGESTVKLLLTRSLSQAQAVQTVQTSNAHTLLHLLSRSLWPPLYNFLLITPPQFTFHQSSRQIGKAKAKRTTRSTVRPSLKKWKRRCATKCFIQEPSSCKCPTEDTGFAVGRVG